MKLGTKITLTIAGTLASAALCSALALSAAIFSRNTLERVVGHYLEDAVGARELELALLEQDGFIAAYLLEGDPKWLRELERREPGFDAWLERVSREAHTPRERELLRELEAVFREYDERREAVVRLYDEGQGAEARGLFLGEVSSLFQRAYGLCEEFVEVNHAAIHSELRAQRRRARAAALGAGLAALAAAGLGAALFWLFLFRVLRPLRRIADEAGRFSRDLYPRDAPPLSDVDELSALRQLLDLFMADVTTARDRLAESRQQLRHAEELATVGRLAAGVAHEIRNPLTSLKLRLFKLRRDRQDDPACSRDLAIMYEELSQLDQTIRHFLEFSRTPAPRFAACGVPSLLAKAIETLQPRLDEAGIRLHCGVESELPALFADAQQIKQVLVNLVNNAMEAIGQGGEIHVNCALEREGAAPPMLVMRVKNDGPAMPDEVRQRIFEPFFSTKEGGTGLGLCIAERIVTLHRGSLKLEYSADYGTCFAVRLPVERGEHDSHPGG